MASGNASKDFSDPLIDFVAAVHGSRSCVELCSAYLSSVTRLIQADAYGLYFLDPRHGRPASVEALGADSAFLDRYEEVGRSCDPLLAHAKKTGEPVHDNMLFSTREWKKEPLIEVMAIQNLSRSLQAPVLFGDQLRATLNFARYDGRRPFGNRDLRLLRLIQGHVAKALERLMSDEQDRSHLAFAEAALDSLKLAIVVTDEFGRRVYTNEEARKLLALAPDAESSLEFDAVVAEHVHNTGLRRSGHTSLVSSEKAQGERILIRSRALPGGSGFLVILEPDPGVEFKHLAQRLTRRELEVLEPVALGLQNRQIADDLHISANTVKHHMRGLFGKMRVNSRAELVAAATPRSRDH